MDEKEYMTIGEAVELLQKEFPDLTSSSLRFLEKEGLLDPQRTPGGHRLYSDDDIARIRLIKHLQSERHYPLDVIRHMLAKLEHARDQEAEIAFLESLYRPLSYDPDFKPLSRIQLAECTGLSPAAIARLEEIGLLFPHTNGNGLRYDEDDLKIAELVARELALNAVMDDFAAYGAAMRTLVQEEFNLFYKLAGSTKPTLERAQQLKDTANQVHALLRAKLRRQIMIRG
ncbi:MAG: MerR family transcriptional regulator [Chloroflexota bacterium]|nr:MerR family transcriptional regulator [Chloroflexota bacterium]